jgi:hypothetical protein
MPEMKCPKCSQRLKVPEEAAGKRVKCSSCEHSFVAESSQAVQPEEIVELPPDPDIGTPSRSFAASRVTRTNTGLRRRAAALVAVLGALTLATGIVGMFLALGSEITVDASHNERGLMVEKQVYNDGLMHKREVGVLVSGTAIVSGILMMGFASLHGPFASRGN